MDDEEDTPILEIPVHVSKRLAEKLYIFQYLNKFPRSNTAKEVIKKCAVKPKFQEVNIEVGLDTESINYDTSKGENFAVNVDGVVGLIAGKDESRYFESQVMDKQVYKTIKAVNDCSNYAVGVLSQNEIHLSPLKGILQLRPSLEYLDKSDKRNKSKEQKNNESGDDEEASTSTEKEPEKITVRFARTESERDKKAREQSFDHFSKQISEEPWIETKWFHVNTCEAELERMHLYASQSQDIRHTLSLSTDKYTKELIPQSEENYDAPLVSTDTAISLAALKNLSLVDQCRNLMKDAKILSFEQIVKLLDIESVRRDELLKVLPSSAVLVRGLWIIKSELLYASNTFSSKNGVPAELMCRSRDYVLYLFKTSDFINRRTVAQTVKIPTEELMEIFTQIAKYEKSKGWQLQLPPDEQFLTRYPDIVQRQQLFWEAKSKQFIQFIKEFSKSVRNRKKSNRESVNSDVEPPKIMNGVHKRDNSCSSDTDSGTERNKRSSVTRKRTKVNNKTTNNNTSANNLIVIDKSE